MTQSGAYSGTTSIQPSMELQCKKSSKRSLPVAVTRHPDTYNKNTNTCWIVPALTNKCWDILQNKWKLWPSVRHIDIRIHHRGTMHISTKICGTLPGKCSDITASMAKITLTLAMRAVDSLVTLRTIYQRDSWWEENVENKRQRR